jgi:hypothetical protein
MINISLFCYFYLVSFPLYMKITLRVRSLQTPGYQLLDIKFSVPRRGPRTRQDSERWVSKFDSFPEGPTKAAINSSEGREAPDTVLFRPSVQVTVTPDFF